MAFPKFFAIYFNIIGSGYPRHYLNAYVDIAIRGRVNWPSDGSVFRIGLPRMIFRKTHLFKIGRIDR